MNQTSGRTDSSLLLRGLEALMIFLQRRLDVRLCVVVSPQWRRQVGVWSHRLQTEERSPLSSPWLELQVRLGWCGSGLMWSGPVFNRPSVSLQECYWSTWLFPQSPCCCSSWWLLGHVVSRCSAEGGTLQLPAAPAPPPADDAGFIVCVVLTQWLWRVKHSDALLTGADLQQLLAPSLRVRESVSGIGSGVSNLLNLDFSIQTRSL